MMMFIGMVLMSLTTCDELCRQDDLVPPRLYVMMAIETKAGMGEEI